VALSLGELPSEVYQAFFDAGAHRYLLRIETSNPELYTKLHPRSHSWENRYHCIKELQRIGFQVSSVAPRLASGGTALRDRLLGAQVGTGVMVGVPFQTVEDMARDLLFFKELQPDMIGWVGEQDCR
jgi:biotin synthase